MRRVVAGMALVAAAVVVGPAPRAGACSCVPPTAGMVAGSEAAFVGTALERIEGPRPTGDGPVLAGSPVTYRFAVERVLAGTLPPTVDVVTSGSGASCGLSARTGARLALVLGRSDAGEWTSGLCAQLSPDQVSHIPGRPPRADGASEWNVPWLAMALGAAAVGAIAFIGERRRA